MKSFLQRLHRPDPHQWCLGKCHRQEHPPEASGRSSQVLQRHLRNYPVEDTSVEAALKIYNSEIEFQRINPEDNMPELILLRHGQSLWNREGRFTGWADIDLSDEGKEEARQAGSLLKTCGYPFDTAYTSFLKRAIRTLWIVQEEMDLMWIPVFPSWRLNERNYGALQGCSKKEIERRYGAQAVHRWRRGYVETPPARDERDERYPAKDPRYKILKGDIPRAESLKIL